MIELLTIPELKTAVAGEVLARLPDWFGDLDNGETILAEVRDGPFWADTEKDILRGFLALKQTSPFAFEIYVMGILPEFHRQGIGKRLFTVAEAYARARGGAFLHVRAAERGQDPRWDTTNEFFRAVGFKPLVVISEERGRSRPCQIYVKTLGVS